MKRISKQRLVELANERLLPYLEETPGLAVLDAETKGSTLILYGECFLTEGVSATDKTVDALRIYGEIAYELGQDYEVE